MSNLVIQYFLARISFIKSILLSLITIFFISSCSLTNNSSHHVSSNVDVLPEFIFSPVDNLSAKVKQTLTIAKSENKKALLVLGAQWCHDSKGLAQQFSTPEMQKILSVNYQTLFIDVGYLEKGFDVVKQFDLPVYYGTPTVMVIDPTSIEILNRSTMQKWLSANNVELEEYVKYFNGFALQNNGLTNTDKRMQSYLEIINRFEKKQATRLIKAYGVIGPLLKQYMESDNKKASDEFADKWDEVHEVRYRVQDDIQTLIAKAKQNIRTGSTEALTLPEYPAFSWE